MYSHPDYHTSNLENDIAIITFSTEATFNAYVQPICVWESNENKISEVVGRFGTVVGWGHTGDGQLANVLRQASVPVVSSTTCLNISPELFQPYLTEKTFCAGYINGR